MAIFAATALLITPATAYAQGSNSLNSDSPTTMQTAASPSDEELDRITQTYMVEDSEGIAHFDIGAAIHQRESPEVIELGHDVNDLVDSGFGQDSEGVSTYVGDFGNRWNWCGKNNSGPGAPMNSADQICQNHDFCLNEARGNAGAAVECDRRFVNGMNYVRGRYGGSDLAYINAAIVAGTAFQGCRWAGC